MSQLAYTSFQEIFYPLHSQELSQQSEHLHLQSTRRFRIASTRDIRQIPIIVFDFETTGLSASSDRIIEMGAIRIENFQFAGEFQSFVKPGIPVSPEVIRLTGIDNDMLKDAPTISEALPRFLDFIAGSLLVAHNAEFDMGFLKKNCRDQGISLDWDCFCSLKMARQLLPELESKSLGALAEHYQLTFEARHRSIGDCKVTAAVLERMLSMDAEKYIWQQLQQFTVQSAI